MLTPRIRSRVAGGWSTARAVTRRVPGGAGGLWIGIVFLIAGGSWIWWPRSTHTRLVQPPAQSRDYVDTAMQILVHRRSHPHWHALATDHRLRIGDQGRIVLTKRVRMDDYVGYLGHMDIWMTGEAVPIGSWMRRLGVIAYWIEGVQRDHYTPETLRIDSPLSAQTLLVLPARHALGEIPDRHPFDKVAPYEP